MFGLKAVLRRTIPTVLATVLLAAGGAHAAGSAKIGTVIWIGYGPYLRRRRARSLQEVRLQGHAADVQRPGADSARDRGRLGGRRHAHLRPGDRPGRQGQHAARGHADRLLRRRRCDRQQRRHQQGQRLQGQEGRLQSAVAVGLPAFVRAQGQQDDREGHHAGQHDAGSDSRGHGLRFAAHRRDLRAERLPDHGARRRARNSTSCIPPRMHPA